MGKGKINTAIKNQLFSVQSNEVIAAINVLKETGNEAYLPLLFELLLSQPEKEVEDAILKLIGTIKDKETIPAFVDALKNEKFKPIWKNIIIACWQNGLDFCDHLNVFTNIVITEDWDLAFEAFTVIENLDHFPQPDKLKEIKLTIAGALKMANEQKAYLLEEILKLMP